MIFSVLLRILGGSERSLKYSTCDAHVCVSASCLVYHSVHMEEATVGIFSSIQSSLTYVRRYLHLDKLPYSIYLEEAKDSLQRIAILDIGYP